MIAPIARPFTIAHLSDLHCGSPYFVANLLDRAIMEINSIEPDVVVCSGDLTTFGYKQEYAQARSYLDRLDCPDVITIPGNHDSRNVGYVHFEQMIGPRSTVLRKDGITFVAVDSSEPDLDHGVVGRGRYTWIEQQFLEPADFRVFVLHHHLLPIPGTGRERNVVHDAGDTLEILQHAGVDLVLSGHKHVPYASMRLRGHTRPCYNVVEIWPHEVDIYRRYPFHGRERIIRFSQETLAYEKNLPKAGGGP